MIEILILISVLVGFHETAKRRGVMPWPFIVVGVLGYLVGSVAGVLLLGPGAHFLVAGGLLLLTYGSIFLIGGGGRNRKESWKCPDCLAYNPPSTLVCLCGHDPSKAADALPGEG